jgi:hypothetical protein
MKSSNMSEKKGVVSSIEMQASPAVGAKCVKSSGSSLSTEKQGKQVFFFKINNEIHRSTHSNIRGTV